MLIAEIVSLEPAPSRPAGVEFYILCEMRLFSVVPNRSLSFWNGRTINIVSNVIFERQAGRQEGSP